MDYLLRKAYEYVKMPTRLNSLKTEISQGCFSTILFTVAYTIPYHQIACVPFVRYADNSARLEVI